MMGSLSGPERVWVRKAKRTDTTTTTSRDSRKTTKKTFGGQQDPSSLYCVAPRNEDETLKLRDLLGTANTLTVMIEVFYSIKQVLLIRNQAAVDENGGRGRRKLTALGGHGGNIWLSIARREWGGGGCRI